MVQGTPAVDWKNPANNAKLFAAVLALLNGTPDYKLIAAAFGPNVPGSAISYRLNVIRKEGAALGLKLGSSPSGKTNGTAVRAARNDKPKGNGRKRQELLSDDPSDDPDTVIDNVDEKSATDNDAETDNDKTPAPPATPVPSAKRQKTIGGRVTKRVSPRNGKKTDYKALSDPFVTMDDAFGEPSGTESEDTYATDGSFNDAETDAVVKMEAAV